MTLRSHATAAMWKIVVVGLALLGAGPAAHAASEPVLWPTTGWTLSTPEEQGVSSAALADLVGLAAANAMDSLLVIRHGKIVLETAFAPFRPEFKHSVNSVTKAVVGTLFGIAVAEGKLERLDRPVVEFFPERSIAHLDANKQAMTLQSLLDMTSGLDWKEPLSSEVPETMLQMARSRDPIGFILNRPMAQAPGLAFNYDSGTWHLLSAILTKKTGTDTLDYARQKLFAPLGISDVSWRRDPQGIPMGGYGLAMQPRDMAKIGYLYLHDGIWDGRQLLPPGWTDKIRQASVDMRIGSTPSFRYASGWWTIPEKHATMAVGFLRQLIIVLPTVDTVVVATGKRHYPFVPLIDRIVGAMKAETPLPADPEGSERLAETVRSASAEKPTAVGPTSSLAGAISGRSYRFAPNGLNLKSFTLDLLAPSPSYDLSIDVPGRAGPIRQVGPLGLDGTFRSGEPRVEPLLAVKGAWLSDNTFQVVSRSVREGIVATYTMVFNGGAVDVAFEDNRGVRAQLHGVAIE